MAASLVVIAAVAAVGGEAIIHGAVAGVASVASAGVAAALVVFVGVDLAGSVDEHLLPFFCDFGQTNVSENKKSSGETRQTSIKEPTYRNKDSTMNIKNLVYLKTTMTVAVAAVLFAGCASSGYKQAEKTGANIAEFRTEINKGKQAIDATMQSLGQIAATANSDPRKAFQQYSKDLANLETATAKVRKRSQEMKTQGDLYFKQWQQQMATVQNADIRKLSEEQKAKMQATFDNIQKYSEPLKAKFDPWLSDLRDLRTYLNNDLSVSGIDAARGLFERTQSEGTEIQKAMDALVAELNNVSTAMTPATAPPAGTPAPSAK